MGRRRAESSAEEDAAGTEGEVGDVDPSLSYIVQFANVVESYQKVNQQLLWVWQPRSPGERLPERKWGKLPGR